VQQHLADEERIALGLAVQEGDEPAHRPIDLPLGRGLQEGQNLVRSQAAEQDALERGFAAQIGQDLGERVTAVQFDVPIGSDHQDAAGR